MYTYIFLCVFVHYVVGEDTPDNSCDCPIKPRVADLSDITYHPLKRALLQIKPQRLTKPSPPPLDGAQLLGGRNVSVKSFPYQAAIYRYTPRFKGFSGGAIIVSTRYLLTAAHCVGGRTDEYSVVIGETTIPNHFDSNFLYGKTYKLKHITIHPEYDVSQVPSNADNDLAILLVDGDLKLNGISSKPIEISLMPTPPGIMAEVSGYGNISRKLEPEPVNIEVAEYYRHLRAAPVPVVAHESCVKYFSDYDAFYHITENMICAGRPCNSDACEGDSGGPLVNDNKLIGIVSFGWGCASYDPGVYTYIYRHRAFIIKATNGTLDV